MGASWALVGRLLGAALSRLARMAISCVRRACSGVLGLHGCGRNAAFWCWQLWVECVAIYGGAAVLARSDVGVGVRVQECVLARMACARRVVVQRAHLARDRVEERG